MDDVVRLATASRMTAASLRIVARTPADVLLAVRIGWFVRRLPGDLARTDVTSFLAQLRPSQNASPQPLAAVRVEAQRIRRVAMAVLSLPRFWHRNTCYVRALVLYRFLRSGEEAVRLHIGIEQRGPQRTLHGHAWLTLGDELLEAPDDVLLESLREVPLDGRR